MKKGGSKAPRHRLQELVEWGMKLSNIGVNQLLRLTANKVNVGCLSVCSVISVSLLLEIRTLPETRPKNI